MSYMVKQVRKIKTKSCTDTYLWASQVVIVLKNMPTNARDLRDVGSIPESGRYPGGGNGNPLQYFRRENLMDSEAWQATNHRVAKGQIQLKQHSQQATHINSTYIWNLEKCYR